jgi:hypothetical protein
VEAAVASLSETARADADQIASRADQSAAAQKAATGQLSKDFYAVKSAINAADARIASIISTIDDLFMRPYLDIASFSGAAIQLVEYPGLFLGTVAARVSMFVRLGKRIITGLPAAMSFSIDQIAAALSGELWLNAILCGLGTTVTDGLPETRAEALSILRQFRDFSTISVAALDTLAKATSGNAIGDQYFPRAASSESVLAVNAAVARYVMGIAFSLKTEKRIVLERPTNPMLLSIREYNCTAADADYYFSLLCRSNNLHGKELLLLDRGREVVVYT